MDLRNIVYEAISQTIGELKNNLASGLYSHDDYLRVCGKISGLQLASEVIEETYRKYIIE